MSAIVVVNLPGGVLGHILTTAIQVCDFFPIAHVQRLGPAALANECGQALLNQIENTLQINLIVTDCPCDIVDVRKRHTPCTPRESRATA